MRSSLRFLILILFALQSQRLKGAHAEQRCGYESCPKAKRGYLNVHIVPHSHFDLGWLKTVDQGYYGDRNDIQKSSVQYTLDSVITELQKNPKRRFILVETGYFWRWWKNQGDHIRSIVHSLVDSGQLEFAGGGWVMNDEANPHYSSIIDQMSLGLRYLNRTFGQRCGVPKAAWQVDTFGHSRATPALLSAMSFDGLFFGRLDYQDMFFRKYYKNMEFIWKGSPGSLREKADLFTSILYGGYNPPKGFCFDVLCNDAPIMDDPSLEGYNVKERVSEFITRAYEWYGPYKSGNVLMTMGSDFHYMAAGMWYSNLDRLIRHVNEAATQRNSSIVPLNVFYSTPACYLKSVNEIGFTYSHKEKNQKEDDFFPYASDPNSFWAGYFSSRPTLKRQIQRGNGFLQACKQIISSALARKAVARSNEEEAMLEKLFKLQEAMAIMMHHDAITGTARQPVADDYSRRVSQGMAACESGISDALKVIFNEPEVEQRFCPLLNISSCPFTEGSSDFIANVYNPLGRKLKGVYVRIPVSNTDYKVTTTEGALLKQQYAVIPGEVQALPGRPGTAPYELVWEIDELAPLSFTRFRVKREQPNNNNNDAKEELIAEQQTKQDFWLGYNSSVQLLFGGSSGLIKKFRRGGVELDLEQNFFLYQASNGDNKAFLNRSSGHYIFRPNSTALKITNATTRYTIYRGQLFTEIHQVFVDWIISQVVRIYRDRDEVEFEWLVGPIPTEDGIGREIITRYRTNIRNSGTFFTDANGRELLLRKRDSRASWAYQKNEEVAGNYYPVPSRIILSQSPGNISLGPTLVLLNDRAQGGSSLVDGELELLLHRRLVGDDDFGVEEPLNETSQGGVGLIARGKHWLLFCGEGMGVECSVGHRELGQEIYMDHQLLSFEGVRGNELLGVTPTVRPIAFTKLAKLLPPNLHLLTLEPIGGKRFLLRLENFYERGEKGGEVGRITLEELREALPFVSWIKETNLGGNLWKEEEQRMKWRGEVGREEDTTSLPPPLGEILLGPMEIKTFILGMD